MKFLYLSLLLTLCLEYGYAQKKEKPQESPWQFKSILYLSDSSGVGSLEYSDKKSGLAFVNQTGEVEKELSLPGHVFGIGKWKGNIVCFYSDAWDDKVDKEIHAVLVDARKKTILSDKLVYQNPGDVQLDLSMGNDNRGNFYYLLIRVTGLTGNTGRSLSNKEEKKLSATTALTAVFLSDKLEPSLRQIPSAAIGGVFLSNYTNRKGDITVLTEMDDQLIAEKFGQDGQLQKKLTSALEFPQDRPSTYWAHKTGQFDPSSDDILSFSIRNFDHKGRHSLLSLFVFDFARGKVLTTGPTTLDKDYFKQLKENPELTKSKHFKQVEDLTPDGVSYIGDKLAVCNEIQYTYSLGQQGSATRYASDGAIVSVYDRELHLQHQFLLDKTYEAFINMGRGFSYAIRDRKLLIFGNELAGIASYNNFYYVLDMDKFTMEKKVPEWGNVGKSCPVNTNTVFWFNNGILKDHSSESYFFGKHVKSYLVKVSY